MNICMNAFLDEFSELLSFSVYNFYSCSYQKTISRNHNRNVALISNEIGERMALSQKQKRMLYLVSILHDNGMVGEEFVQRLEMEDIGLEHYESMVRHCISGESNIRDISFYKDMRNAIICHHENWDGSGFFRAKGEEIPLYSQIIRLADELDLNFEIHRLHEKKEEALAFVDQNGGRTFSPHVAEAGRKWLCELEEQTDLESKVPVMDFCFDWDRFEKLADIIMRIIDHKSQFTYTHSHSVSIYANALAAHYKFDDERRCKLRIAAKLHDLGKLRISNTILEKPGRLTDEQFCLIKEHPGITREILSAIPNFEEISFWTSQHHEKLDGSGYPEGLQGASISLESRMLCICDIFVALTEDRPYRGKKTPVEAMDILVRMGEKGKLDREILEAFKVEVAGIWRGWP